MKQTISKSKSKKGRKRRKNKHKSISTTQERRQHARGIRILQARKEREGGVAPRRNNRITESTKESREAKIKAKKAIQETDGKRQDEKTKRAKKDEEGEGEHGERQKGEEKRRKKKRKEK